VLHGDIIRVGNWTCTDNCKPTHPDEITTIELWDACTESRQTGSLQIEDHIDLACTGMNITCDDLNNASLANYRQELYSNCNQDEDLLTAHCELYCRLDRYPTKVCIYQFDRINKYGMQGESGMYGFHHCVLHRHCLDESNTSLEENGLYCNITDTHELLFSSTGPTTGAHTGTTTTTAIADGSTADKVKNQGILGSAIVPATENDDDGDDDDGGTMVVGIAIGGGAVALVSAVAVVAYFKVCRKGPQKMPSQNTFSSGTVTEENEGSTVVVGRPVPGESDSANPGGEKAEGPDGKVSDNKV
jgi:hypothetical protein